MSSYPQDSESANRLTVIVPAYNEADRLPDTLSALRQTFADARIVVADDGSRDETAKVALSASVEVTSAPRTIGKGGAVNLALEQVAGLDLLLLCDGDLGESAAQLAALVDAVNGGECDLAVATFRQRVGGGFGVAVGFAHWAIKNLTGLDLCAPISGQRALNTNALAAVTPFAPRFGMETAMTIDAARAGLVVREYELELEHRATGRTLGGFLHRARQLKDFVIVYLGRRWR